MCAQRTMTYYTHIHIYYPSQGKRMFTRLLSYSLLPFLIILILSGCSRSLAAQVATKKASPHPSATTTVQRGLGGPARTFNMPNGNAEESPLRLMIPAIGVNAS